MPAIREIKERIASIQSTMKITNAMYMISSTKMNYAKQSLAQTEPYFYSLQRAMQEIMHTLPDDFHHPYLSERDDLEDEPMRAIIVVTADKGLAGSYNHNVLKMAESMINASAKRKIFVVGEAGRQYFIRKNIKIDEHYIYTAQKPSLPRARQISSRMLTRFEQHRVDEVYVVYTKWVNATLFVPDIIQLLPLYRLDKGVLVGDKADRDSTMQDNFMLGPDPTTLLDTIIPGILSGYIYSALVESYAAEHFARMTAMDAANKNGEELLSNLQLQYNRQRQAKITQEITEVAAGAKARKMQLKKKQQLALEERRS